jgi:hypothetical protein
MFNSKNLVIFLKICKKSVFKFTNIVRLLKIFIINISMTDDSVKIYEPRHDKTNIMGLRPAWIQAGLRGCKPIILVLSWRGSYVVQSFMTKSAELSFSRQIYEAICTTIV